MTNEQAKVISEAIKELAKAVEKLAASVAEDEPLNYTLGRGLDKVASAIEMK